MRRSKIRPTSTLLVLLSIVQLGAGEPDLTVDFFTSIGYTMKSHASEKPTEWEQTTFHMTTKTKIAIRSTRQLPRWNNAYYRYEVVIESFPTRKEAKYRLAHLMRPPPGLRPEDNKAFPLKKGFIYKKNTYIISTDVHGFFQDKEFARVFSSIQQIVEAESTQ